MTNSSAATSAIGSIRKYHPLFKKLSFQGSKIIFSNGKLIKLKASQILYKQSRRENVAYIILYGKIAIWVMEGGVLSTVDLHDSVGEESFLAKEYKCRYSSNSL